MSKPSKTKKKSVLKKTVNQLDQEVSFGNIKDIDSPVISKKKDVEE
jgi:hypothetical protein